MPRTSKDGDDPTKVVAETLPDEEQVRQWAMANDVTDAAGEPVAQSGPLDPSIIDQWNNRNLSD